MAISLSKATINGFPLELLDMEEWLILIVVGWALVAIAGLPELRGTALDPLFYDLDASKQVYQPHGDWKHLSVFLSGLKVISPWYISKVVGYVNFVPGHILTLFEISLRCVSIFQSWI